MGGFPALQLELKVKWQKLFGLHAMQISALTWIGAKLCSVLFRPALALLQANLNTHVG